MPRLLSITTDSNRVYCDLVLRLTSAAYLTGSLTRTPNGTLTAAAISSFLGQDSNHSSYTQRNLTAKLIGFAGTCLPLNAHDTPRRLSALSFWRLLSGGFCLATSL